jgi:hypothetical protein
MSKESNKKDVFDELFQELGISDKEVESTISEIFNQNFDQKHSGGATATEELRNDITNLLSKHPTKYNSSQEGEEHPKDDLYDDNVEHEQNGGAYTEELKDDINRLLGGGNASYLKVHRDNNTNVKHGEGINSILSADSENDQEVFSEMNEIFNKMDQDGGCRSDSATTTDIPKSGDSELPQNGGHSAEAVNINDFEYGYHKYKFKHEMFKRKVKEVLSASGRMDLYDSIINKN